jgi:phosphate transport system permease protein
MALPTTIGVGGRAARDSVHEQLTGGKADPVGRAFRWLLLLALGTSVAVLAALFVDVVSNGAGVFADRFQSFWDGGIRSKAATSGISQALRGTFWIGVFVVVFAFPIGVASAIYLEEYASKGRIARLIDVNIRNLAGVPSIVYGILGLTIFVKQLDGVTGGRSLMSAGITLAILVLPIVIITAAEAIRAVPGSLREAGYGVGATRSEVVRNLVLPYSLPGIITGTVLALARALGEAAPLYLCGAVTGLLPGDQAVLDPSQLTERFTALPVVIAEWAKNSQAGFDEISAAAIVVMLAIVLVMNSIAIALRTRYEKKRS